MPSTVGDKVKQLRELRGWSQQKLAEKCGFSVGFISKFETNAKAYQNPTISTIKTLASVFGVPPSEIFTTEGPTPFSRRLQDFREDAGMSIKKLSKKSGISEDALKAYEEGTKFPNADDVMKLTIPLNKFFQELMFPNPEEQNRIRKFIPKIVINPLLGGQHFDENGHIEPETFSYEKFHWCPQDITDPFAYAVDIGPQDAMEPAINNRAILICTTNEEAKDKDLVILLHHKSGMVGGEISFNGDKISIKPFHPKDRPETYMKKDIKAIHRVVWIRRK